MKIKVLDKLNGILFIIQLYSYLLPTFKIGNRIMDFRLALMKKINQEVQNNGSA